MKTETVQHNHNNRKNFKPQTKELLQRLILPNPNKLSSLEFDIPVKCMADIWNRYVKIDGCYFYFKRINQFGDTCICKIIDNGGTENIATVIPCGKSIELAFRHFGIRCRSKIKFTDIFKTDGARYEN